MKIFQCSHCAHPVFFENTKCERCYSYLGYVPELDEIFALDPTRIVWTINHTAYVYCSNNQLQACNWLVPNTEDHGFCIACNLNRTIPDLSIKENVDRWRKLEIAKHRLVYSLLKLPLPIESKLDHPDSGLCFDFLSAKVPTEKDKKIMTGHANGVITIVLAEADSVSREQIRRSMKEPYRTLIGHFRHEVGHYYWQRIVFESEQLLDKFRETFGDERESYAEALKRHYKQGAPPDWQQRFISEYASSHPWEDWAETWAHYFHIINTMETAYSFGLKGDPTRSEIHHMKLDAIDPYSNLPFKTILDESIPLFYAVNSINRSMGIPDVYPFVISDQVVAKLTFIHRMLRDLEDF